MEQVSRMAAEVNKLIGRNLLDGNALYLPEIGSLYIAVNPEGVQRIDFSSAEQGASIVNIIKDRAGCSPEQASEIFSRWKAEVGTPAEITIEGVGALRGKTFVTVESFATKLNSKPLKNDTPMAKESKKATKPIEAEQPAPEVKAAPAPVETPKKVPTPAPAPKKAPEVTPKKSSNKTILICVFVIIAIIGGYLGFNQGKKAKAEKARIEAIAQQKAAEQQRIADSIAVAQIEARRLAEKAAAEAAAVTPRYKVVYGVYELRSNVDVAIAVIDDMYGDGSANEYPFAGLTLVSMFESDDRNECQQFLMDNYDAYPDTWIHDSEQ